MNIVEEAIRQWELYRAGVVAELELIPEEQFPFRPSEGARSVRALARHIYHRGQLALYARQIGLVPALTRQMESRGTR